MYIFIIGMKWLQILSLVGYETFELFVKSEIDLLIVFQDVPNKVEP